MLEVRAKVKPLVPSKVSLYECFNAKVFNGRIYCDAGHMLGTRLEDISVGHLQRGEKLELTICRNCPDFDYMGEPVRKEDRGWTE